MKKYLTITLVFASCGGENRNELMTRLIDLRRIHSDMSISYRNMENLFRTKANDTIFFHNDPLKRREFLDSADMYERKQSDALSQAKRYDESIDSLAKMK